MTKRPASSLTTPTGAGVAAAVAVLTSIRVSSVPVVTEGAAQSVHPSQAQPACPSGIIDPFETANVAVGVTWLSLTTIPVSPASASVTGQGGVIPTTLTLTSQDGGGFVDLSAVGYAAAHTSQRITTGTTAMSIDIVLILFNPGPVASVVNIDGYGTSGSLSATPHQVTVPTRSSASVLLVGWFPDEGVLAVHVTADEGEVATQTQAPLVNGEISQGIALASVVVPATTQTIPGVDPKGTSLLRLTSPSGETHASASVVDSTGIHPLVEDEATVTESTTLDMPLDDVSSDSSLITLIATSDRGVVAQTTTITLGAPWAQRASVWIVRSNATPTTTLTGAIIPGAIQVESTGRRVPSTTPIHATSLVINLGVTNVRASLLLYAPANAPASSNDQDVTTSGAPSPGATPNTQASLSPSGKQSEINRSSADQDPQSSGTSASIPEAVIVHVGGRTIYAAPGIPTLADLPDSGGTPSMDPLIQVVVVVSTDTAVSRTTAV